MWPGRVQFRPGAFCGFRWRLAFTFLLGFFSGFSAFPPSTKINISKFQFDQDKEPAWKQAKADVASSLNIVIDFIYFVTYKCTYYTDSSLSRQDESNPALWLATRAGKMELSCLLGTTAASRKKNFPESHIIIPLFTKLVRSRWLDTGLVHKKNLANIQPSWPHTWSITHISILIFLRSCP